MSDSLTLFPVNRNNCDLYVVINFTHSQTIQIERVQRDIMLGAVMYAYPAKLPGPRRPRGLRKTLNILTLLTLYPQVHPSSEVYYMGFRWTTCQLWSLSPSPTLLVILKVGWTESNNYSEMLKADELIHVGIQYIVLFF